jgi:hypothetical protein
LAENLIRMAGARQAPPGGTGAGAAGRLRAGGSQHAPLLAVLAAGAILRLLTQLAYGPALYYYDSVSYVERAGRGLFLSPDQPAGYPLAIRVIRFFGGDLGVVTTLQHLAGMASGAFVYVLIWRLSSLRWLATLGAAIVILDGYAIAIEQYVMTEALFDFLIAASGCLAVVGRRRMSVAVSGLLLAAACMVRPVGLFAVPVWLAFVFWRYRWSAATALCTAAVLFPLLGYAAANDQATGHFAITEDSAWLLYGRIGAIGDCRGLRLPTSDRVLCPQPDQVGRSVNFYLFAPNSPAVRAFGTHSIHAPPRVNRTLFSYSLHVISQRPLAFAGRVGGDLLRFFTPGARSDYPTEDAPMTLPRSGPWLWPFYRPRQRSPARALRTYISVVHTIRPLLGLFFLAAVAALALAARRERRSDGRRRASAIALLLAMALALMLGSALSHFERRYALPAVPLLTSCGLLAIASIWNRPAPHRQPAESRRARQPVALSS